MKILNLYSGIGGNRKKWPDHHEVVAVEKDQEIADVYSDKFPQDRVIVGDAHKYLRENFSEFDFIWSSPPCPTHSRMRKIGVEKNQYRPKYPDMDLYEEILFLKSFFKGDYVVENVNPFYEPLIKAQKCGRHLIWSNFTVEDVSLGGGIQADRGKNQLNNLEKLLNISLEGYDFTVQEKVKMLRNCVHPDLGLHVLKSRSLKQSTLQDVELT
jgi:DNA (cytosine-5)-methyltransferase 1